MTRARERLYDLLDQGVITHEQVVDMCMGFMSESEVEDLLDANELSERFDEDDEDYDGQPDEEQEWESFDPDC
jgi:hypothetical protein